MAFWKKDNNNKPAGKDAGKKAETEARRRNRPVLIVSVLFVCVFLSLAGYLIYILVCQGDNMANSPYNRRRQNLLAEKVVRGSIITEDGETLAKTEFDENGEEYRTYPYGRLFSHVVGYSLNGGAGMEASNNINLLMSHSLFVEQVQKDLLHEKNIGDNVITTLNVKLQQAASDALGDNKGAAVVMDPKTGAILAMVSKPDYDPNSIPEMWDYYTSDEAADDTSLLNRATQGLYPPGSIFKILTTIGYLRQNNDQYLDYQYNCTGSITMDDITINCYHNHAHGALTLESSFAQSCNSSFVNVGTQVEINTLRKVCGDFLFNEKIPLNLACSKSISALSRATDTEKLMQTVIGQGDTLVTPLHMAIMAAAIGNNGVMMRPYLVSRVETHNGTVVRSFSPEKLGTVISQSEAQILKQFMRKVVTEGTATSLNTDAYSVAGKTGSAEYGTKKGNSHSWFVCFSPVEDPQIAISVILEEAGSGSEYAVPVAKKILNAFYDN